MKKECFLENSVRIDDLISEMKISVIICTYNRCVSLKDTLGSLQKQAFVAFAYEIIVVDNNSSDSTRQIVESFNDKLKPHLRYIFENRQGISYARNRGIVEASGEIVAFTDDDVLVANDWLSSIESAFKNPAVHCVAGKILAQWNNNKPRWYSDGLRAVVPDINEGEEVKIIEFATGANMAFRKSIFDKIGFFEIGPAEDSLFSHMVRAKYSIWYFPSLVVFHKTSPERLNQGYFRKWYFKSGRSIAFIKNKFKPFRKEKVIFGVPRWMFRWLIKSIWGYLRYFTDIRKRFYCELQIIRFLGICDYVWRGK
ncbi:MAG: glycosyltransferase [Candidatus Omnitrophica bacterium]|nr:glycosyltransferase [Candidatus Omnitrophota bacterium]